VGARIRFYQIACIQQLARILIVLALCLLGSIPPRAMGLAGPISWYDTGRVLTILAVVLAASIVLFHFVGDWQLRRLLKMVGALVPVSAAERRWFALVSLGAGVSEEIVFRGFLFFYLATFTNFSSTQIIVASSLLFGFCHIYQGWFGVLGTSLAGFCLAFLYAGTGSLLVPIVVHAALDLRLLLILTPKRIEKLQPAPPRLT
jgi:membrane protease YdiL (CAAX protease family)